MWNFRPRFPWWKKAKDPRDEFWRQIRETKQTYRNTKILTFALIIASATLKSVSLPLNGMLMIWKIQQAMQDDAIPTSRIHPIFIPVTGLKCSYGKKERGKTYPNSSLMKRIFRYACASWRTDGYGSLRFVSPHPPFPPLPRQTLYSVLSSLFLQPTVLGEMENLESPPN